MSQLPTATESSPTSIDQRVRLVIEAEIFQDSEGGPESLIVTTDTLACEPTSPARLLGMVADARAQLDQVEQLANKYEAADTFRAIVAEHNLIVEEWDTSTLDLKLRSSFVAFAALLANGDRVIVVPPKQDPVERLAAVASLIREIGIGE